MALKSSNYWMDFFLDTNLPQSVATRYAVVFTDHRIQENMLGDLTKDMLYDMGIKTMGDVIAILKHAKEVNDEKIQLQLLGKSNMVNMSNQSKSKVQYGEISKEPISGQSVSSSTSGSIVRTAKRTTVASESNTGPMKVRRVINSVATTRLSSLASSSPIQAKVTFNSISTKPSSNNNTSVRRINAHQDSETRKISVFNRLGDSNEPTSTAKLQESKVTRTITGLKESASSKYPKTLSVKDRLGGKKVIKNSTSSRIITNSSSRQTAQQQSRNKISLKKSIFDRLGTKSF